MKLNISILLLLLTFTGIAQVNIVNRSLTNDSLPILYAGMENQIEIVHYSPKSKSVVTMSQGEISNLAPNPNKYIARSLVDSIAIITIREKNKTVFSRSFAVESIPDPVAMVGGITDSTATVQQVLISGMLRVNFPNCFLRHNFSISSFHLTIIDAGTQTELPSPHYIFPPEMVKAISKVVPGAVLRFDNIRMMSPDGRTRKLKSFSIRII